MGLKDRIIDAACDLFVAKGYDQTTISDIMKAADSSKGGLYYHFKSKDEILERIIAMSMEEVTDYYEELLEDQSSTVVEKFTEAFYRLNEVKKASVQNWDQIKKRYTFQGNHLLLKRMGEVFEEKTADFYCRLIQQGIRNGEFHVSYPKQLGTLWSREVIRFYQMSRYIYTGVKDNEGDFYEMLRFNESLINSQLGLSDPSVHLVEMGEAYLQSMKEAVSERVL